MLKKRGIFLIPAILSCIVGYTYCNINKDLILAVSRGNLKEVQTLVEKKGANINTRYDKGKTPLHWASVNNNLKIVAYLVSKGADVNARDDNQATPLHLSAIKRNLDIVKYLILKGADINAVDKYGWTPLHYFAYYENSLGLKYLIMEDAVLTNESTKEYMDIPTNSTAMDIAFKKNYSNIIFALENPDKYRVLSKKPFLSISSTNLLGDENILIAPGNGFIKLTIENKGGFWASNVITSVEQVSNCEGLTVGSIPETNIDSRSRVDLMIPIAASKKTREGTALLRLVSKETNFIKESEPLTIEIPTLPPQPALISIKPQINIKGNPEIYALEDGEINIDLTNTGRGFAEDTKVAVLPVSNCTGLTFSQSGNIFLPPKGSTNISLEIKSSAELKDGLAEFIIKAEDLNMNKPVLENLKLVTKRLLKPLLTAEIHMETEVKQVDIIEISSNILTNEEDNEILEINTNSLPEWITNDKPVIYIKNTGETNAYNVKTDIEVFISGIDTNSKNKDIFWKTNLIIPEISANNSITVNVPAITGTESGPSEFSCSINAYDERKYAEFKTNIVLGRY